MARIRIFLVLVLALTAGGAFAFGTYRYIQQGPERGESIATKPVIVAALNLQLGAELRPEDLRIVEWPASAVPASAFGSADQVVGRGLIQGVVENEPILPSKLAPKGAGAGLPPVIPAGMRALSVRVNDVVGVAGYVLPGTRVDVVATVNPTQQQPDVTSKVVLTNVLVLAAGTKIERDTEEGKPLSVSVNPLDTTAPATPGIKPAALMASAVTNAAPRQRAVQRPAQVVAAAPAAPLPTVEIIRGDKRAQEVVR
jgi:pilus assembly protein CpaB